MASLGHLGPALAKEQQWLKRLGFSDRNIDPSLDVLPKSATGQGYHVQVPAMGSHHAALNPQQNANFNSPYYQSFQHPHSISTALNSTHSQNAYSEAISMPQADLHNVRSTNRPAPASIYAAADAKDTFENRLSQPIGVTNHAQARMMQDGSGLTVKKAADEFFNNRPDSKTYLYQDTFRKEHGLVRQNSFSGEVTRIPISMPDHRSSVPRVPTVVTTDISNHQSQFHRQYKILSDGAHTGTPITNASQIANLHESLPR